MRMLNIMETQIDEMLSDSAQQEIIDYLSPAHRI